MAFQMAGDGFTVSGDWLPPPDADHPAALKVRILDATTGAVLFDTATLGCTPTSCELAP